jgi:cytoskeletal protein RodZ
MTVPPSHSFGEELRRERLVRDISLEEISSATKISVRLLKALEASDLAQLPSAAFTRGFIRAYARHLGVDPEEKVNAYLADLASASSPIEPPKGAMPRSRFWRARRATVGTIVGGLVAVLLVLGFIASPARHERPTKPVVAARRPAPVAFKNVAVSNEPTPVVQDPAEEAAVPRKTLALEFSDDSWAKIDADGETVVVELIRRGNVRRFETRDGFRLTVGNAGAVRISLDGHPLEPLGGAGEVIRDLPVPRAQARG